MASNPSGEPAVDSISGRLDKLYEFERAPVTPDKLHDGRYFAAMFSGEHVAGTEFIIGALFVQWGATARDLLLGLLLGNLLAVLSWAFICAPIAVRTRLTLYWYARRIIGPGLTVIYNIVNALLYCFLAAAMIGVSASAVGLAVKAMDVPFVHPRPDDLLPNSATWVIIVLAVGAIVIMLAVAGFKRLSQFAAVCSPWMFCIFLAGAIATLPGLGSVRSVGDLWHIAETEVWNGEPLKARVALPATAAVESEASGTLNLARLSALLAARPERKERITLAADAVIEVAKPGRLWRVRSGEDAFVIQKHDDVYRISEVAKRRLGFWHLTFFAWFCNLAMHVGLSDMAVFRYARRWTYGFHSAFGMYLGHYAAWACAGIMGAVIWGELDPGQMANTAAGPAGLLCVLLAGWTTANPTIYRAGLALQIITPNWPRWLITLVAGGITTLVAIFPAIFNRLLEFVALYGLSLMPIGAVIFTEHWIFPKLKLRQYWTERKRAFVNGPALITWAVVLFLCFPWEDFFGFKSPMAMIGVDLFFRWLPGWFLSVLLYVGLCLAWPGTRGAGEVEVRPDQGSRASTASTIGMSTSAPANRSVSGITWGAGGIALLALLTSLAMAIWVFVGGSEPDVYKNHMKTYKLVLGLATIVYFLAATFYATQRERARPGG